MTTRERTLAGVTGALVAGVVGFFGVRNMVLGALESREKEAKYLQNEVNGLRRKNRADAAIARQVRLWAGLTYDTDELRASAKVGTRLVHLVERAGLSAENFSVQPVGGAMARGAYKEIGRTIRVRGRLKNVVNFLYLLRKEPYLSRLDNLSITPAHKTNEVNLSVRYVTLVVARRPKEKLAASQPSTAPAPLDSEERTLFEGIVSRDLMRPYIQRRPEPVVQRTVVAATPRPEVRPPPPPPPKPTGPLRLVGLPDWNHKHDIIVEDTRTSQINVYKPGDTLGGGVIVMVDYRQLPSPEDPKMLSPSRAILRIGPDYYAVELGDAVAGKRLLSRKDLPERLRSAPRGPLGPPDKVKREAPSER